MKLVSYLSSIYKKKKKIKIRPPTTYSPTTDQRLAESLIMFGRHGNRNIFIFQNTNAAGKTYNYTLVYYPKGLLVSIKHIRMSQLYLFFSFKTSFSSFKSSFLRMDFFSVHSLLCSLMR